MVTAAIILGFSLALVFYGYSLVRAWREAVREELELERAEARKEELADQRQRRAFDQHLAELAARRRPSREAKLAAARLAQQGNRARRAR